MKFMKLHKNTPIYVMNAACPNLTNIKYKGHTSSRITNTVHLLKVLVSYIQRIYECKFNECKLNSYIDSFKISFSALKLTVPSQAN